MKDRLKPEDFQNIMVAIADIDYNAPYVTVSHDSVRTLERVAWLYLEQKGWSPMAALDAFYGDGNAQ